MIIIYDILKVCISITSHNHFIQKHQDQNTIQSKANQTAFTVKNSIPNCKETGNCFGFIFQGILSSLFNNI